MPKPTQLWFLPGASGNQKFWHRTARLLQYPATHHFIAWPGFGGEPERADITSVSDLSAYLAPRLHEPTAIVAQSMGGIVAVQLALQHPEWITHVVLSVTSGGVDMSAFQAQDWRPDFEAQNLLVPDWFLRDRSDLSTLLPSLKQPVLLLWGDADPISPVAVGQHLEQILPCASLYVFPQAGHDLGHTHAEQVAPLVDRHLL